MRGPSWLEQPHAITVADIARLSVVLWARVLLSQLSRSTSREAAHERTHVFYLLAAAIQLLVEALGIEGVGRSGDAGQNCQSDQGGCDGLHDWYSLIGRYGPHHRRPFASHLGLLAPCDRAG